VRGYRDSLRQADEAGGKPDQWRLRGPFWRLSREERALPIFRMEGRAVTAEEFLRSLDQFDQRSWPVSENELPFTEEIQALVDRELGARHAEALGLTKTEEWQRTAALIHDDVLLDEYHDLVLTREMEITPAQAAALYEADPQRWKIPERVDLAAVIFPEAAGEEAREFAARVRNRSAEEWTSLAEAAAEAIDGTIFLRTTEMLDVGRTPDPPEWAPLLAAAETLQVGSITGPVPAREMGGTAVVRLIRRLPPRLLSREVGLIMAERELRLQGVEARLTAILQKARARERVQTFPERLGPP
jgi:hypothetical protein